MQVAVFRWKAVGPLLLFGALWATAWVLFADWIARRAIETVGTAMIGAKVEVRSVALRLGHGNVAVRGLTVASPFKALENLFQADELVGDLDLLPLLEKKVVIDRLAAKGLRFGTTRTTDGRTGRGADGMLDRVERWGAGLRAPALDLAPGELERGSSKARPPTLDAVQHPVRPSTRPPVRRSCRAEPEPLRRQAIDHDLLLEQREQVEIPHELVGLEQVFERLERARDGEPAHRDVAMPQPQRDAPDLHLRADHCGADRLDRSPGDPIREQHPRCGPKRPEEEQRSHGLPPEHGDLHLRSRGGTGDRCRTASTR